MTKLTITGRATADAELRFLASGVPVASFTVADNHRKKNAQTGEWEDDGATFYNVQAWNYLAEECAENVRKGRIVIVVGDVRLRQYETRDGGKGSSLDVRADEVGMALPRFASQNGQNRAQETRRPSGGQSGPGADPWAAQTDEAPF